MGADSVWEVRPVTGKTPHISSGPQPGHEPGKGPRSMFVYLEDDEPIYIEMLTLDEATRALAAAQEELSRAFNSVHAVSMRYLIGEIEEQIEWLHQAASEEALSEAALDHAIDLFMDRDVGDVA